MGDIAASLTAHAQTHRRVVEHALQALANDFASPDSIGPMRAAQFDGKSDDDLQAAAADAHGYVDDLLRACSAH